MTITSDQTAEGVARMSMHTHGTPLEEIVTDVYAAMRALEPAPVPEPEPLPALPWLQPAPSGVHPDSARLSKLLWDSGFDRPGNINVWDTYAVYQERIGLPWYAVVAEKGIMKGQEVLFDPNWPGNTWHSDNQMIVHTISGNAIEFYEASVNHSTRTITAKRADLIAAGMMQHPPSRGCGIPYHHMLITEEEALAGEIPHALSLRVRGPHCTQAWWPASKVEGTTGCTANGIPEGARFRLGYIPDDRLTAWAHSLDNKGGEFLERFGWSIFQALRIYGFFITDNGGGSGGFDLQGPKSWQQDTPLRALALSDFTKLRDCLDIGPGNPLIRPEDITLCPETGPRITA